MMTPKPPDNSKWNFWIDVGGTFTDCVAVAPDGREHFSKVLSSGLMKGRLIADADPSEGADLDFFDLQRTEVDHFWNDAKVRLINGSGECEWETYVAEYRRTNREGGVCGRFRLGDVPSSIVEHARSRQRLTESEFVSKQHELEGESLLRYELDAGLPAPILGIHLLQKVPVAGALLPCQVDLGTTRGTNALLTRTGVRTALVTSQGFRDFLRIGDQARTKLFALAVRNPVPLFQTAVEIHERVLADGTISIKLDEQDAARQLAELKEIGIESLAVCLMFGFRYPEHERRVAEIAAKIGFRSVRCSHEVAPVIKIVPRGETTVLDAYLDPVIANYLSEVQARLPLCSPLRLMTSSGGLVSKQRFSGKDSVLSGPAGGVVGASQVGRQLGFEKIIGFDMGGTSTDVSRYDGHYARSFEAYKAGVRIVTPMLEVETVAAGGGSRCWFDGSKLRVGPQSAGAEPGPACYGRGGPLAVTDVNLFLGRFQPDQFPFALDLEAVERRIDELIGSLKQSGYEMTSEELANGFLQIANHNMAAAIESVSIAKGFDPRDYVLVSFGGAGSQHCCSVAERLGMTRILDHPQASVLSAVGIRLADQTAHAVESVNGFIENDPLLANPSTVREVKVKLTSLQTIDELETRLNEQLVPRLTEQAIAKLRADGNEVMKVVVECALDLRYQGTEPFLTVAFSNLQLGSLKNADHRQIGCRGSLRDALDRFLRLHQQQFGYLQNRPIELVSVRVDARVAGNHLRFKTRPRHFRKRSSSLQQPVFSRGGLQSAGMFSRRELFAGDQIIGPAVIADAASTTIVDCGWEANVFADGILLLEKRTEQPKESDVSSRPTVTSHHPDPIQLEIFNNHFSAIASQMGIALQKTSVSVNVKERLDFSCAIFSATGDLVVNAPHIPVHLGAMSETVRSIIAQNPLVNPGDVFATNDPYAGGSHLPDVTVVTPVFALDGSTLWFWVASRSHHAEIGGMAPGSMPAGATRLGEEGVLIQNFALIVGKIDRMATAVERFDELRQLLTSGPYPSRSPDENIADLKAQVAANRTGANQLDLLVKQYTFEVVSAYMGYIQDAAEQKVRAALKRLPDGEYPFSDQLDNGATIRVILTKLDERLTIDFTGTDPVLPDNLNANRAIVSAAVMYVLRLLIDEEVQLNEGILRPVILNLPESFLNPQPAIDPFDSPAIVGGNVETSQRIVDCLLGALGLAAASQGTMNNWLMGNESFGYYETVGGGSGATEHCAGADAVHCHMTNTRLTDPEILEARYPVVLRELSIRRDSGGAGKHRGGDGMIREIEFLQPMTLSLLTSRRVSQPFGLAGGQPGKAGLNRLIDSTEGRIALASRCEVNVQPGDRLRLETPGGGGWGAREV